MIEYVSGPRGGQGRTSPTILKSAVPFSIPIPTAVLAPTSTPGPIPAPVSVAVAASLPPPPRRLRLDSPLLRSILLILCPPFPFPPCSLPRLDSPLRLPSPLRLTSPLVLGGILRLDPPTLRLPTNLRCSSVDLRSSEGSEARPLRRRRRESRGARERVGSA